MHLPSRGDSRPVPIDGPLPYTLDHAMQPFFVRVPGKSLPDSHHLLSNTSRTKEAHFPECKSSHHYTPEVLLNSEGGARSMSSMQQNWPIAAQGPWPHQRPRKPGTRNGGPAEPNRAHGPGRMFKIEAACLAHSPLSPVAVQISDRGDYK